MTDPTPLELMESAWAARRAAFDLSDREREAALDGIRQDLDRAARMLRDADEPVRYAHALHLGAHVAQDTGDEARAEALWTEAVATLRKAGAPLQLAHKIRHLGDLELARDDLQAAALHYAEALDLYRKNSDADPLDFANAIRRMAMLKERLGEDAAARELWLDVRGRFHALGVNDGVLEADRHLADREP